MYEILDDLIQEFKNNYYSNYYNKNLNIINVIYNPPATIVLWNDNTKTVVKCEDGTEYDKEMGLYMCLAKKLFGNTGRYNRILDKWCWSKLEEEEACADNAKNDQDCTTILYSVPHDLTKDEDACIYSSDTFKKDIADTLSSLELTDLANIYEYLNKWKIPNIFIEKLDMPTYMIQFFPKLPKYVKTRTITPLIECTKEAIVKKSVAENKTTIVVTDEDTWETYTNEHKNMG